MDWDFAVIIGGMASELAIILLMIRGRSFRTFPVFSFYLCWSLFCDSFLYYIRIEHAELYFRVYFVQLIIDSLMIFAVLVELGWSVLRPIRNSLPKHSWVGIAVLFAVGALILWPIAGWVAPANLNAQGLNLFRLQQTPAILRALSFLALAAFSHVLSIGLRDRELQIATGLGFYSITSLAVTILHVHQQSGTPAYYWLDLAGQISYLAALFYWVFAFAKQPAERREFTPQMKTMLLAVAGAARSGRIDLEDSTKSSR